MTAKRLDHRAVFVALSLLVAPAVASAQYDGTVFRLPPGSSSGSARGVVQPKAQPQLLVQPSVRSRRFHPNRTTIFPRQSSVDFVPAIVTNDGRVFANFGFGYEQVFRACAGGVVVGQPSVIAGNGLVLTPQAPTDGRREARPDDRRAGAFDLLQPVLLGRSHCLPLLAVCVTRSTSDADSRSAGSRSHSPRARGPRTLFRQRRNNAHPSRLATP
jgi:hypothetical protein